MIGRGSNCSLEGRHHLEEADVDVTFDVVRPGNAERWVECQFMTAFHAAAGDRHDWRTTFAGNADGAGWECRRLVEESDRDAILMEISIREKDRALTSFQRLDDTPHARWCRLYHAESFGAAQIRHAIKDETRCGATGHDRQLIAHSQNCLPDKVEATDVRRDQDRSIACRQRVVQLGPTAFGDPNGSKEQSAPVARHGH